MYVTHLNLCNKVLKCQHSLFLTIPEKGRALLQAPGLVMTQFPAPQTRRKHTAVVLGTGGPLPPSLPLLPSWLFPSLLQSIQPTANLDRTDDQVYFNVMELVRAVLDLKDELSQLPPEGYVVVVKVRAGSGRQL